VTTSAFSVVIRRASSRCPRPAARSVVSSIERLAMLDVMTLQSSANAITAPKTSISPTNAYKKPR
jgi:hypothetical protein